MNIDWMSQWGNYIVSHRTPENWRAYGFEAGEFLAKNEWDEFLFYRDASELSLTPAAVAQKADELARETVDDFRLYGTEMWRDYGGQNQGTPRERKIWVDAFVESYTETMQGQVASVIPSKLVKNLDRFCALLSWMRMDMDSGNGSAEDYGLRLSGKKGAPAPPPTPKDRPTRGQLREFAERHAKQAVERRWRQFMLRHSDGTDLRSNMMRYETHIIDEDWAVTDLDRDYFGEVLVDTFQRELGKKALELAPASAWKNSYLICVLYDQMLTQERPRKKKADGGHSGFWVKRNRDKYRQQRQAADRGTN